VQWLLYRKEDLVLMAKTSFGKSLVWQILPCLVLGTIVIAILLGASSIQKYLAANAGVRPIFVNHIGFLRTSNWQEVSTFAAHFRSMVKWLVVDELHLVSSDHVVL
jgi:hypothetical protein